ncbi:hypothetical protein BJF85_14850 [Saccharomonospora sp. CUA-673]|nr:hypothetical protein BJF85_14850 [Saccharomonospora sp. CUA-673]
MTAAIEAARNGSNGTHPVDESGETSGASAVDAAAVDLTVVQADDVLLNALGGPDPQAADELSADELGAVLLAWRRDIDTERIPELVDIDTAVTEIKTAALARKHSGRGHKRRFMVPVAAAAAVLAIGFTGTSLAARDAQPGDTLWGLSKVLYADHARSVEAAASVRSSMDEARLAMASDRYEEARSALSKAETDLRNVTSDEAEQLKARHTQLMAQLDERPDPANPAPPESSEDEDSQHRPTSPDESPRPTDPSSPTTTDPSDPTTTDPTDPTTTDPDDSTTTDPDDSTSTTPTSPTDESGSSPGSSGSDESGLFGSAPN